MKSKNAATVLLKGDSMIIISLWLLSSLIIGLSRDYPVEARRFPQLVAGAVWILCIIQMTTVWLRHKKELAAATQADSSEAAETKKVVKGKWYAKNKWVVVLLMVFAHFLIVRTLGFIISTILLLTMIPLFLGYRKVWIILISAVVTTVITYFVFSGLFYVPLPRFFLLRR